MPKLLESDLSGAKLTQVDLSRTNLVGTDLSGTGRRQAGFEGANLSGARLWTGGLHGDMELRSRLQQAKLESANFRGAVKPDDRLHQ